MTKVYYDRSVEKNALQGKKITTIGYGSQGHAHAQNLKDNGHDVKVSIRPGDPFNKAKEDKLDVYPVAEAVKQADVIMILFSDEVQDNVYKDEIAPNLETGNALAFAHRFSTRFDVVEPPKDVDAFLVAPEGPGHLAKYTFVEGSAVPTSFGVQQDATGHARDTALSYARGIGATYAGITETMFKEEAKADLFGEQTVLCEGVYKLIQGGFGTLVETGYREELAYFEVLHEMKLIADLMYEDSMENVRYSISDTAESGDYVSGPRAITPDAKDNMKEVPKDIQNGNFANHSVKDDENGFKEFYELCEQQHGHEVEAVGRGLRRMMPFIKSESTQK